MSTYTQIFYQIVFSTKNREKVISESNQQKLFNFIWGILKNNNCHLYRINGVEDHIHILTHLHPSVALADLVNPTRLIRAEISIKASIPQENSLNTSYIRHK